MSEEEYILLYERFLAGKCSEDEQRMLEDVQDDFLFHFYNLDLTGEEQVTERNQRIYSKLRSNIVADRIRTKIRYYLAAACLVMGMFSISYFFLPNNFNKNLIKQQTKLAENGHLYNDSAKTILTLASGDQIILDTIKGDFSLNDVISGSFKKSERGELVYNDHTGVRKNDGAYNSIRTLRGGEYQLVLPDGTKVWLNSESSLKFPVAFTDKERRVELVGEAYFEVAKNKEVPFKVFSKGIEIKVLGTQFNVNSYKNVTTTLAEGAVELITSESKVLLVPGEKGELKEDGRFRVVKANLEAALAWRNGYFFFEDESIKSIMERIARWYNIEVQYKNQVEDERFYGKVLRTESLEELLGSIELASRLKFKIIKSEKDNNKSIVIIDL
ncbi:FecR family protein [Pseudopedobacter beijingensis]|uniref:FecR family protein n=1 Tax=Pseudopedobacter beijingensis TaxID=1207056 RepID=A0ABW4I7Y1_9SPHI